MIKYTRGDKIMWDKLPNDQKILYKKLILGFASLSDAFAQKAVDDEEKEEKDEEEKVTTPFINSKFQETVFRKSFNAFQEDIRNTSYDSSIIRKKDTKDEEKYLIGIKTFRQDSKFQKIAQFKTNIKDWESIIHAIQKNAKNPDGTLKSKKEVDKANKDNYKRLALELARLRNMRIASSIARLKGFEVSEGDNVESIYHVLMTTVDNNNIPKIYVGEFPYNFIDTDSLEILGCTSAKHPVNFTFRDKDHVYRFTSADSQLLMDFSKTDIKDTWNVTYIEDVFSYFQKISENIYGTDDVYQTEAGEAKIIESHSWKLVNKHGEVERYSGINGNFALGSKIATKDRNRAAYRYYNKIKKSVNDNVANELHQHVRNYLNNSAHKASEKVEKEKLRNKIMDLAEQTKIESVKNDTHNIIFRPADEAYIPITNAKKFHQLYPNLFGDNIAELKENSNGLKKDKKDREFTLILEPSNEKLRCFLSQDNGKGIESVEKQSNLGKWLHNDIFQLKEDEPLTAKKLNELHLNAVRLYKTNKDNDIHIVFIWIDDDNLPDDYFE